MDPNTLNAIADKHRGIIHTLAQVEYAERFGGENERERQLQLLLEKRDSYVQWMSEHLLDHDLSVAAHHLPWQGVISVLCCGPEIPREQRLALAREAYTQTLIARSHHDTICELAKLDPSWWTPAEAHEVEAYMSTLNDDERAKVEAARAGTADE